MRKISADYIFPVSSPPVKNGMVEVDDSGRIISPVRPLLGKERGEVERYEGIVVPCFVNTHCHLELSYLKGKMPKGRGLDEFVREIEEIRRNFSQEEIQRAMIGAEEEMIRNGIVAVGDISNSDVSFSQKAKGRLRYHTFLEVLGFHPGRAEQAFKKGIQLQSSVIGHPSSITPHSPYAASEKLLDLINEHGDELLTFHNQESEEENLLFQNKTGKILERLKKWGIDTSEFRPTGTHSLQYILPKLNKAKRLLLVHNTFTSKEDLNWITSSSVARPSSLFFCFCPNANLYIENRLPDIPTFIKEGMSITIGTDSLASNDSLSVLSELQTIASRFPEVSFETMLGWATKNGAEFLGMEAELGTIEKGKRPGLNLLTGMGEGFKLSEKVSLQKLI